MRYPNIYTLFRERVAHFRAGDGAGAHDVFFFRRDDRWHGISWARFDEEAHDFAYALLAHGLTRGASVRAAHASHRCSASAPKQRVPTIQPSWSILRARPDSRRARV